VTLRYNSEMVGGLGFTDVIKLLRKRRSRSMLDRKEFLGPL